MKKYYLFLNTNTFKNALNKSKVREIFNWYTLDQLLYHNDFKEFRKELATRKIMDVVTGATFTLYDYDHLYDMHITATHFEDGLEYHLVLDEQELDELQKIARLEYPTNEREYF